MGFALFPCKHNPNLRSFCGRRFGKLDGFGTSLYPVLKSRIRIVRTRRYLSRKMLAADSNEEGNRDDLPRATATAKDSISPFRSKNSEPSVSVEQEDCCFSGISVGFGSAMILRGVILYIGVKEANREDGGRGQ